jgi:UDP-3-O-[3-hydroxymyristoyl] glucosamine N-acyltransferase
VYRRGRPFWSGPGPERHRGIREGHTTGPEHELDADAPCSGKAPAAAPPAWLDREVKIGANCSIGPGATSYYDVSIGNGTLVGDRASVREQCRIGSECAIARNVPYHHTTVGDRTKIVDSTRVTGNCTIGNEVFIRPLVSMTNNYAIGKDGYAEDGPTVVVHANLLPGASW